MKAKKSLGQNFLTSEAAIFKIVSAAKINPGDPSGGSGQEKILEVGPGKGVLTKSLLAAGAHVIAVEKDSRLIEELREKFGTEKFTLIEKDILETTPEDLGLEKGKYKIVANLPYYITGQFLRVFLSTENHPETMVLLLQKEVVDRIIAQDKKESLLSLSIKAYGAPKKITVVNRGSFQPAPNVDSAVIAIENISKNYFDTISEEKFFSVIKAAFAHKRKILASNLAEISDKEKINTVLRELNIPEKSRAEDLTLEDWKKISEKI